MTQDQPLKKSRGSGQSLERALALDAELLYQELDGEVNLNKANDYVKEVFDALDGYRQQTRRLRGPYQ